MELHPSTDTVDQEIFAIKVTKVKHAKNLNMSTYTQYIAELLSDKDAKF